MCIHALPSSQRYDTAATCVGYRNIGIEHILHDPDASDKRKTWEARWILFLRHITGVDDIDLRPLNRLIVSDHNGRIGS